YSQHHTSVIVSFLISIPPHPRSPLFPYTTLFRSTLKMGAGFRRAGVKLRMGPRLWARRNCTSKSSDLPAAPATSTASCLSTLKRSEEHTSELQSRGHLVCRLLLEKKKKLHISYEQ